MSTRERLTWGGDKNASARLPVEDNDRRASAHPATPDEGITHPAGYDDPVQPNAYENGDTSSWAEDVHPGPYENSAHPATPDEGPFHPAAKRAARELRAAVERKAAKCIRIATDMLGKTASVADVEKQALTMMDLPDTYVDSTFSRLAKKGEEEEEVVEEEVEESDDSAGKKASRGLTADDMLLRRMLAEEDMDEDDGGSDKEAGDRLAGIESALAAMQKQLTSMGPMAQEEVVVDEDEAMLANLLAQEEGDDVADEDEMLLSMMLEDEMSADPMMGEDAEAEALLSQMMGDEMGMPIMASDDEEEEEPAAKEAGDDSDDEEEGADKEASLADYIGDAEMHVSLTAAEDPMGLAGNVSADDVLTNLYKSAGDDEEEESDDSDDSDESEDEGEDEESEKEGKKASARKPRPKKASRGARTIGQPSFDKTASNEINDLERLWKSAPDITDAF
ncbi:hypothetical protein N9917_00990 [Deltaproteobacteria bacterium]|nr:hypothetical protein [Deltaproteobacteria bacterium]